MLKKETLSTLEWLRDIHLQMLKKLDESERCNGKMLEIKENGRKALEGTIDALDDALCELRMIPEYNRDELMASLRYAQEHLAVDYSGMDAQAVEKLDDALDAIFAIVKKLIGEEENA